MKINTSRFGEIEFDDSDIINFAEGLPGFFELNRYALIRQEDSVFCYLQAIDDEDVAFALVDMAELVKDYDPLVDSSLIEDLGKYEPEHFMVLNIAVIPENVREMTVNLKAPIVINWNEKKGKQVICANEEYQVRHRLFSDDAEISAEKDVVE